MRERTFVGVTFQGEVVCPIGIRQWSGFSSSLASYTICCDGRNNDVPSTSCKYTAIESFNFSRTNICYVRCKFSRSCWYCLPPLVFNKLICQLIWLLAGLRIDLRSSQWSTTSQRRCSGFGTGAAWSCGCKHTEASSSSFSHVQASSSSGDVFGVAVSLFTSIGMDWGFLL